MENIIQKIRQLNSARAGSLAELAFALTAARDVGGEIKLGKLKIQHADQTDFVTVSGRRIDVKSRRFRANEPLPPLRAYQGPRVKEIEYGVVEFYDNGARISLEGQLLAEIDENKLETIWREWLKGRAQEIPSAEKPASEEAALEISSEVKSFFTAKGFAPRVIYRTCEPSFGKESPGNLKPTKLVPKGISIYLSFYPGNVNRDNLYRLIAFPDNQASKLPMHAKTHLHLPKVNLEEVDPKYKFKNIHDLLENYFKRFPKSD